MDAEKLLSELKFKAVRSSGAGGQNVNKVSSKVVLSFDLQASEGLNEEEKFRVSEKISSRLTTEGILNLNCDEDRSQFRNKELVQKRFLKILQDALAVAKIRKATRIPKSAVRKRLKLKSSRAEIKKGRKRPGLDD
ncbi:alternative ribosome rescue aminoacyl-tRNA hydrolase ArfB [Flavobacterium ardleyense]|uniref:alternative ribosome rescue aminoacyl-tRNA hydrolase ArfB n=1 Tax=Flavobacterium ardleyense TaxID=2038737 RepID=UPI00298CA928|nr:alternative ribosome rescue aminoacyl-tRNA hydrolase ArfB [Flavobacterium ardleyense]